MPAPGPDILPPAGPEIPIIPDPTGPATPGPEIIPPSVPGGAPPAVM